MAKDSALAAIDFALKADEGLEFLRCWQRGDFDVIRKEWPDAPKAVFVGADPLFPPPQEAQEEFYRLHEERSATDNNMLMEMVEVISKAEKALISLDRMATRDALTGLANRRAGEKVLLNAHGGAQQTSTSYSVLLVDIDYFKRVNDTHGHEIGDAAIKAVAAVLGNTVRGGDVACRWGGEEFLCILKGADIFMATLVAERIREAVELTEIPIAGKVTVSIGVATWCITAQDAAYLVKAADQGLYEAKQNGRNRVVTASLRN
jgi:diguanylate cyclase (GGDEF)-like protein